MIKNIFVPEKIGSYYIFPKRVIGFDIGKSVVHACKVYLRGYSITIEKCFEERITPGDSATHNERAAQAIRTILDKAEPYDAIYSAIDSSRVVYKKLTLPFTQYDKIKKVVFFEVEPLLPFPLHQAVVDFIIIDENKKEGKSDVLVAAVQHEQLEQYLQQFEQAGVDPEHVTVDLFSLYGLYLRIPSYVNLKGDVVLIDLGVSSTRIAYIHDGNLSYIRTLGKGLSSVAKMVGDQLGISSGDAMEKIMRFGVYSDSDPSYAQAINKAFSSFLNELSFTLRSFSMRTDAMVIKKILLLGIGSDIKGLPEFVSEFLQISCERFNSNELFKDKNISITNKQRIDSSAVISLSAALPSPVTEQFNLKQEQQAAKQAFIVNRQLITALVLAVIPFAIFLSFHFLQVRKLNRELVASEKQAVRVLKDRLVKLEGGSNKLGPLVESADEVIAEEEKDMALLSPSRLSYLNYLLELITRVDKKALGLTVERISFDDGSMILKGKVKDFDALRKFEDDLRESKLFKYNESQEKLEFDDLRVDLVPNSEEL